jgi:hypothetical protein
LPALVELLAAIGDVLSAYQDAIAEEEYLGASRLRRRRIRSGRRCRSRS